MIRYLELALIIAGKMVVEGRLPNTASAMMIAKITARYRKNGIA